MPRPTLDFLSGSRANPSDACVVNIFGGPGTGKSTVASQIFADVKRHHIEAACPEEHAKLAIWSGQPWLLDQQIVLLGRTWETLHALLDKVELIIVDSPALLCSVYSGAREPRPFHELVADIHRRTNRVNILIARDRSRAYSPCGRRETETEAMQADDRIRRALDNLSEPYLSVAPGENPSGGIISATSRRRGQPAA